MSIQGPTKTEANYRAVLLDSSSSLKDFSMDRKKYYQKYILNEEDTEEEEEDSQAVKMGKITETLLLEPELFDSRFYMSAISKAPTGKMLDFVNALVNITFNCINDQGVITRTFEDMATEARTVAEFEWSLKVILDKFIGKDPEIYYNEIRQVRANKLSVVTAQDVTNAERIVTELKNNFVTSKVVNLVNSNRWKILNQLQIEGYEVDGHLFKSMMDKVIVDHQEKTIQVYDLKCVWAVEKFYEKYYLYRRAYIQGYLYWQAAKFMTEDKNSDIYRYVVLPPKFIVCDSINYYNPLIYEMSLEDLLDAYDGFEYKGVKYPGVGEIIADLQWAWDNGIWNMSKSNHMNNGIVGLKNN